MTPREFVAAAYAAVQTYTDSADGTQMHRRAATGRRIAPFVHATGVVTARLEGQYVDVGVAWHGDNHPHAPGRNAGEEFARLVNVELACMAPPIPEAIYSHGGKREGAGRPETPDDEKREVYTLRLPRWLVRKLRATPEAGKAVELALLAYGFKKPEQQEPPVTGA